jgi:ABC-type uncharacterized transport system ATPase subunit
MLSSHLLSQVQSVCDRIGIFASGRLVGQGTVDELAEVFGDGTATIEVELDLPDASAIERAKAALGAIRGVETVQAPADGVTDGVWRLIVRPAAEEARIRREVLVAAVEHDLGLSAIRALVPSLDDIYRIAVGRQAA